MNSPYVTDTTTVGSKHKLREVIRGKSKHKEKNTRWRRLLVEKVTVNYRVDELTCTAVERRSLEVNFPQFSLKNQPDN